MGASSIYSLHTQYTRVWWHTPYTLYLLLFPYSIGAHSIISILYILHILIICPIYSHMGAYSIYSLYTQYTLILLILNILHLLSYGGMLKYTICSSYSIENGGIRHTLHALSTLYSLYILHILAYGGHTPIHYMLLILYIQWGHTPYTLYILHILSYGGHTPWSRYS